MNDKKLEQITCIRSMVTDLFCLLRKYKEERSFGSNN
jgi:hypothetical protein